MRSKPKADPSYLDLQAEIGITKHNGGYPATDRLLELCRAGDVRQVLYVGTGIGVGPSYLARSRGCRVVAADISPKMLDWTRIRAKRDGVEELVELALADVVALPFEDGRFDLVIVESVLAFVADKQRAIAECVRVTRPGGWVGMNEVVWIDEPPQGGLLLEANSLGTSLPTQAQWRALWEASGLVDRAFELNDVSVREELRSRLRWIGWRWLLPAWGRAIKVALTDARARRALREQLSYPPSLAALMGYVLSAGRRA
ncbi:MAG: class I SAM-dependent methyltransferase [Candidatus Nanopelagicales bacterium]